MNTIQAIAAFTVLLVSPALHAASLTVAPVTIPPGGTADAALVLQADGAQITQIQFNLDFDVAALRINAEADAAALKAGKDVSVNGSTYMVIGLNQTAVADGKLVLFHIAAKSGAAGQYALRFSKVVASDKDGRPVSLTAPDATVTVGSATGPQITGVVNGASFENGISSASWVTILGANLAPGTRLWAGKDFIGNKLPASLDGVRVLIGNKPAFVYFISPVQLNVLAPDDDSTGPVSVQVITPEGQSSVVMAARAKAAPGFFMLDPEGRKYVAAYHADGSLIAKPGLYAGLPTRPAQAGETITLYGTGFGPTSPAAPASDVVAAPVPFPLTAVTIGFGGADGVTTWAGLIGSGLYQINVRVPSSVRTGDVNVVGKALGASSSAGAFITIGQ
jgi:uncharacterized protein (TIGR03437 family)